MFARQQLDGFGFDVEDLYIARVRGFRTVEVAVRWNNVEGTKVSLVNGLRPFFDLLADSLVSPGRPLPASSMGYGKDDICMPDTIRNASAAWSKRSPSNPCRTTPKNRFSRAVCWIPSPSPMW